MCTVCLCVGLFFYLPVSLICVFLSYICISVHVFVHTCISTNMSFHLSVPVSISLSVCPSVCPFGYVLLLLPCIFVFFKKNCIFCLCVSLSVYFCLCVCPSTCLSVHPSVCVLVSPSQVMAVQTQLPHAQTHRLQSTCVSAPSSYDSSSRAHSDWWRDKRECWVILSSHMLPVKAHSHT